VGRSRTPPPVVVCRVRGGVLSLWCRTESAGLLYAEACEGNGDETIVLPLEVLEAAEGAGEAGVALSVDRKLQGRAGWMEGGVPSSKSFAAVRPGNEQAIPERPGSVAPAGGELLRALHECGRTAARESGRFILTHLQIDGAKGRIVGTDARHALVWQGLTFSFTETVLVPAVPVFGCRELAATGESCSVGVSRGEFVVAAGPWTVFLPTNIDGKYPDVTPLLLKPGSGRVATLDSRDAAELLSVLPELPGRNEKDTPVTLDLERGVVVVRGRDSETRAFREVPLRRSRAGSEPVKISVNRSFLARILELGCHTLRINPTGSLISAEAADRLYFVATLGPESSEPEPKSPSPLPSGSTPMKPSETNGAAPAGRHDPPVDELIDPIVEAEALRVAVAEVGTRLGRLLVALRGVKRERKTLTSIWHGLKQLNLGPGGTP
ncbi:MAG TPA: hypothetical protein VGI99_00240, partial [Gemmataceae bacterium]